MSHSVPRQQSAPDAARSASSSTPPADRPLPDFQPHTPSPYSPIDREIERSERASAALAAARALARASFTDSQLAAEDASDEHDIDTSGWVRTEYAGLDQAARPPQDEAPRNLIGGTFNPGIASLHGRAFPSASSIAHAPIRTRSGAQARFLHESRQAPRPERGVGGVARSELSLSASTAHYDKPAVIPMLAPASAGASPGAQSSTPTGARARTVEPAKALFAAGLGAAIVLMGGGVAWKAGLLARNSPSNAALITPAVATQAEAARVQSAAQEIAITPAAGVPPRRSEAEIDAALAAAARAAAVPAATVRAAGPSRLAHALPPAAPIVTTPGNASTTTQHAPAHKESVAEAIANAQARADRFLASDPSVPAPAPATPEPKPAQ